MGRCFSFVFSGFQIDFVTRLYIFIAGGSEIN